MARHVFELGYRRYEWKCDALNAPSRAAATRLGFAFEGVFRQALVTKGRNRDTAWFAMTDQDWPLLTAAYERWLDPANFEDPEHGERQRVSLRSLTAEVRALAVKWDACPTIRDAWHTELSAVTGEGHAVAMRSQILVRTRRVS